MRNLLVLSSFFVLTPSLLLFCLIFFSFLSYQKNPYNNILSLFKSSKTVSYAALPTTSDIVQEEIVQQDARVEMVRQFFARYSSPLEPFAELVVSTADIYGLDFRLIPAIAMQESNLCSKAPENSHNCWGFGIYGTQVMRFSNYEQAIETVTKTLSHQYKKNGLVTPEEIMSRYTPASNGSWARAVTHFMNLLQ